jgi:hypothetical protein
MNLSKWLVVPAFALVCCLGGCGPDTGTTVIESAPQSTGEIASADSAYEQEAGQSSQGYEN